MDNNEVRVPVREAARLEVDNEVGNPEADGVLAETDAATEADTLCEIDGWFDPVDDLTIEMIEELSGTEALVAFWKETTWEESLEPESDGLAVGTTEES